MLTGKRFRISKSSSAIEKVAGGLFSVTIAAGEIVRFISGPTEGDRMVDVHCNGRSIAMFAIDLKTRGIEILPC